jgi:hypothetical protein
MGFGDKEARGVHRGVFEDLSEFIRGNEDGNQNGKFPLCSMTLFSRSKEVSSRR